MPPPHTHTHTGQAQGDAMSHRSWAGEACILHTVEQKSGDIPGWHFFMADWSVIGTTLEMILYS